MLRDRNNDTIHSKKSKMKKNHNRGDSNMPIISTDTNNNDNNLNTDDIGKTTGRSTIDNGYNNCKIVFMFYVVLFHMANNWYLHEGTKDWTPYIQTMLHRYTLWHEKLAVPGFAFLSGLFGKNYASLTTDSNTSSSSSTSSERRWKRTISMLFVGVINIQLFEIAMKFVLTILFGTQQQQPPMTNITTDGSSNVIIIPTSVNFYDHLETWYLLALLCWRMMTPFISMTRHPLMVSILLAVMHVHVDWGGGPTDLRMRVFRFFPFYVAGLVTDRSTTIDRVTNPTLVGSVGILLTLLTAFVVNDTDRMFGIYYSIPSWSVEVHLILLFQYVYAMIAALSVILVVKQVKASSLLPWSHLNSTLAIYVWHWYVLTLILFGNCPFYPDIHIWNNWPLMDGMKIYGVVHPFLTIFMMHVVGYVVCVILGCRSFWYIVRPIVDPNIDESVFGQRQRLQREIFTTEVPSSTTTTSHIGGGVSKQQNMSSNDNDTHDGTYYDDDNTTSSTVTTNLSSGMIMLENEDVEDGQPYAGLLAKVV